MMPRAPIQPALLSIVSSAVVTLGACAGAGPTQPPPATTAPPAVAPRAPAAPAVYTWKKLDTVPYKGKQDDIFFLDPERGFYVNGSGRIYGTTDGGERWVEKLVKPGTFFRSIGFVDAAIGFAGNVGTDYFPGVTDTTPLYGTRDGGQTWAPVTTIGGDPVKGLCAIDILSVPFINAGQLDHRVVLHAAGRVGGPAVLATSDDSGLTWTARDLSAQAGMILDVKFTSRLEGFLCAGSSREVEASHALILKTTDGGQSWVTKYESTRPFEDVWKCSFPSAKVGYGSVQSYDERPDHAQRYVVKTVDGGETWVELPLVNDGGAREFGVGFLDENVGWVGTMLGGFQTVDGGKSWSRTELGKAANKFRILHPPSGGAVGYAIGVDVYKLVVAP